ncbi:glycosyl hydrolase 2 galactose-binding domain-containing protein [Novosphingobium terrae]|uniref:glycosyl hydrolase 2 galactose-binding domain-containing protein n=1 Tax=Novosphingobium terrae TaxID=2726189 RepID=UPI00197CC6A8|nr:LamG-like jellyroll fold domain-containing protein [Novosphingobium terrae]
MIGRLGLGLLIGLLTTASASAQIAHGGPYNTALIAGGTGLSKMLEAPVGSTFTLHLWVQADAVQAGTVRLASLGEAGQHGVVALRDGTPVLILGNSTISGITRIMPGHWHFIAASLNEGVARLFVDGVETAHARIAPPAGEAKLMQIGPRDAGLPGFSGRIADLWAEPTALSPETIRAAAAKAPDAALIQFEDASPHWPVQVRQMAGQVQPQDAWTLPKSAAAPDAPRAAPLTAKPAIEALASGRWAINGWQLAAAPTVKAQGEALSRPGADTQGWYAATVPGTVLTTLVDRGVYPDPAHGLNNMAIPESLARQDYWYRSEFDLPPAALGRRLQLVLNGANYAVTVWVNGTQVGTMTGAFIRGRFEIDKLLHAGRNAIAIKVSPPPHPGLAQEESLTAGNGDNGGVMMLDGPTFGATEGWDWIPSIRDRNTGLWQGVDLVASGDVRIGDAQVVTTLPRPDNSVADIAITVPVHNLSDHPVSTVVRAAFDAIAVSRTIQLAPGERQEVRFSPASDAALAVHNPKLWWPNGYGDPALHQLQLTASVDGAASDAKEVRFGMREVSYEISLIDSKGALRRVGLNLARAQGSAKPIVDVRHQAIRQVPGGWAYSLSDSGETSPAVTPIKGDAGLSPFLVIRVNGVKIAARGGNIGMDDFMKRVDRARLEPYFRLHRDAHVNIVRNWIGQNTEENFFDLADEYGMMVLNDFWESTQDYNIEAQDVPLFLKNADDVVKRFRNHPSIVVWFGRNEGVPQPILNEGLDAVIRKEDGTRLYMGSSNRISLHDSGPYNWQDPAKYFTDYSNGFAVEVGTPSFPTLEAWERAIPASERWPISDSWAYHDWHQLGNGGISSFTDAMAREFGPATSLPDFERKAQMLEYESYRAIFEGMNAGLWTRNSGRMLWMTQPAWPSSAWQMFSSDYDTHGAFYGVKKASEPVHVQMNLPDHKVILVNNTRTALSGVTVCAKVVAFDGRVLASRSVAVAAAAGQIADAFTLDLGPLMQEGPVLVRLEAMARGQQLSDNFYWQARDDSAYRALSALPPVSLSARARMAADGEESVVTVEITNPDKAAAIETKLTLFDAQGQQVLPAYFSDNYVSLLPGESRSVTIHAPREKAGAAPVVRLRGFNVAAANVPVG